jgi:hypothetical protein
LTAPLFGSVSSLEYCNLGRQSAIPARRFDRGNVRHYRLCAPSRGTSTAVSALNFLRRRIDLPILGQRLRLKTVPPIWLGVGRWKLLAALPLSPWVDTVEKGFCEGSSSNIDSRRASNEQHRFARIRLFQTLIPQLRLETFSTLSVNRVGFAIFALHPLIPRKRPYSGHRWMSQKCH